MSALKLLSAKYILNLVKLQFQENQNMDFKLYIYISDSNNLKPYKGLDEHTCKLIENHLTSVKLFYDTYI